MTTAAQITNITITMLEKFHLSAGIQLRIMVIYESAVIWC